MEINVSPLENLEKIESEICEFEGCDCKPEIEVSIFKRKREEDDLVGKSIHLFFANIILLILKMNF